MVENLYFAYYGKLTLIDSDFRTFEELKIFARKNFGLRKVDLKYLFFYYDYGSIKLYIENDVDVYKIRLIIDSVNSNHEKNCNTIFLQDKNLYKDINNKEDKYLKIFAERNLSDSDEIKECKAIQNKNIIINEKTNLYSEEKCNNVHLEDITESKKSKNLSKDINALIEENYNRLLEEVLYDHNNNYEDLLFLHGLNQNSDYIKKFKKEIKNKMYNMALLISNRLICREPNNSSYLHARGLTLYYMKDYTNAINQLEKLKEKNLNYKFHNTTLVKSYYKANEYKKCLNLISFELKLNPENTIAHFIKAKILAHEKKYTEAIYYLNKYNNLHRLKELKYFEILNIYISMKDYENAKEIFNNIITKCYSNAEYHIIYIKFLNFITRDDLAYLHMKKNLILLVQHHEFQTLYDELMSIEFNDEYFEKCKEFEEKYIDVNSNFNFTNSSNLLKLSYENNNVKMNKHTNYDKVNFSNNENINTQLFLVEAYKHDDLINFNENNLISNNNLTYVKTCIERSYYSYNELITINQVLIKKVPYEKKLVIEPLINNVKTKHEFYDYNPDYDPTCRIISCLNFNLLKSVWENPNEIFAYCSNYLRKDLKIHDLTDVAYHVLHKGDLYYFFKDTKSLISLPIRIIDCFSNVLFSSIRKYLLQDNLNKLQDIANVTKYNELKNHLCFFSEIYKKDFTILEMMNLSCTNRIIKEKSSLSINTIESLNQITKVYSTIDYKFGVTVNINGFLYNYEISKLKQICSEEIYNKFMNSFNCKQYDIEKVSMYMDLKVIEFYYKKLNNKQKLTLRKKLEYERRKNENNCFLFALISISDKFTIRDNALLFKNIQLSEQIDRANQILNKHNQILLNVSTQVGLLKTVMEKIVGKSLLIFYNDDLQLHAEGIINCNFSQYCQDGIKDYLNSNLTIIEMKIFTKQDLQVNN